MQHHHCRAPIRSTDAAKQGKAVALGGIPHRPAVTFPPSLRTPRTKAWTNPAVPAIIARMSQPTPRLAVRALILDQDRLLIVNAYPGGISDLWCAPGGGARPGTSLPENLAREVMEETGLTVSIGAPALINEFHDPASGFHQVDLFFRASITGGTLSPDWRDPGGVVSQHRFVTRAELARFRHKPDSLAAAAWGAETLYDPLEVIVP